MSHKVRAVTELERRAVELLLVPASYPKRTPAPSAPAAAILRVVPDARWPVTLVRDYAALEAGRLARLS